MKKIDQKECREVQLSVLDEVARICKENNLKYSLAYGTLLGAVRHKGYIPWDDDIDIFLLREDYDKLIAILKDPAVQKKEWLTVVDDACDGYYYGFAKAYDNRTHVEMERHKGEMGIWVDLFPLDGLPKMRLLEKPFVLYCSFLRVVGLALSSDLNSKAYDAWTRFYKRVIYTVVSLLGKRRFCRYMERVYRRFSGKESGRVATLFFDSKTDRVLDLDKLTEMTTYPFENREYEAIKNYDYYLSEFYGDYMQLPPEEKRITHGLEAFWK